MGANNTSAGFTREVPPIGKSCFWGTNVSICFALVVILVSFFWLLWNRLISITEQRDRTRSEFAWLDEYTTRYSTVQKSLSRRYWPDLSDRRTLFDVSLSKRPVRR
jgi:hypothetical protein